MDDNDRTLKSYESHINEYIAGTPQAAYASLQAWRDHALEMVPSGGTILELGSGFGRDAVHMQSSGYHVIATDAVQGFVDILQKAGLDNRLLNALTDDFGSDYDMVYAHAVLVHFDREQTMSVIKKALKSLKAGGVLAFSVKQGDGSKWTNEKLGSPRLFYYWQRPELEALLTAIGISKFEITEGKSRHASWLFVIASKP